jgi:hypothetical protein
MKKTAPKDRRKLGITIALIFMGAATGFIDGALAAGNAR